MVELLNQNEGVPAAYPDAPSGLSTNAAALDTALVWGRIEGWIRYRWEERSLVWIVQGPGVWVPPLRPYTVAASDIWAGSAWGSVTLTDAPVGFELGVASYRVTATVGDTDDPPEMVLEAYGRLAEYMAEIQDDPVLAASRVDDGDYSMARPASWAARAIHLSGAADLLRQWR